MKKNNKISKKYLIGVASSQFYSEFLDSLEKQTLKIIQSHKNTSIIKIKTPGCMELPLASHWLFKHKKCDAVICLGIVIRGRTTHYDSVCRVVEQGLLQSQLYWSKPIISGVLMAENKNQIRNRLRLNKSHKGQEAVKACFDLLDSFHSLTNK